MGDVYRELDQFNVTVIGGRVLDVGVGGLILGGGLSYLSDIYGLACDNVVNFEVVLADGNVVNANSTSNEDLFWSLKGGGNNFGSFPCMDSNISAHLSRHCHKIHIINVSKYQVWGGVKAYTLQDLSALHLAMYEYQTNAQKDPRANLMMQGYVSNETIGIVVNMFYAAPLQSPAAFEPFYHINTTADTTKITLLTEFYTGQGPINFPPRIDWRATSFIPEKTLYDKLTALLMGSPALGRIKSAQSGTVAFGLQPISASAIEAGIARGGNALGLQKVNQTWYVIDSGWLHANDDHMVHTATKDMIDSIQNEAEAASKHLPYIFANDASFDQDVMASYGPENAARLKVVSAKYDPQQVFQRLVPGGFKLYNSL